jgi:hypothetical protein
MFFLVVILLLMVLNYLSLRRLTRLYGSRRARIRLREQAWRPVPTGERVPPAVAPVVAPAAGPATGVEYRSRALPIEGTLLSPAAARGLEQLLRCTRGVLTAYVSPVTALAYVEYQPSVLSDAELADTLGDAGFCASDAARWFPWRHADRRAGR